MPEEKSKRETEVGTGESAATATLPVVAALKPPRRRMGDLLVSRGEVTRAQLEECLALQKSSPGERLGQILVRKDTRRKTR